MDLLTKAKIMESDDKKTQIVEVPEWGGHVKVKTMSGTERDAWEDSLVKRKGKKVETNLTNIRAKLCAVTIVDEEGVRLFNDSDILSLGQKSCSALDRVFQAAKTLNALDDDDIEDLAKNSEPGPSDSSTSN